MADEKGEMGKFREQLASLTHTSVNRDKVRSEAFMYTAFAQLPADSAAGDTLTERRIFTARPIKTRLRRIIFSQSTASVVSNGTDWATIAFYIRNASENLTETISLITQNVTLTNTNSIIYNADDLVSSELNYGANWSIGVGTIKAGAGVQLGEMTIQLEIQAD